MSENKSPAFQFYYKEWITGTMHMTRIERDIYLLLLIASYDRNGLPTDKKELDRIALCKTKSEKDSLAYVLKEKFIEDDGTYRNKRMEKVRTAQKEFKLSKSQSGKKGAQNRWQKNGTAIVSPSEKNGSTSTTTSTTDINTKTLKGREHFEHMREFYSLPYEQQQPGFKNNYTVKEYEGFKKFLFAMLDDMQDQLEGKFDKCMNIGDWKKFFKCAGYLTIKPFLIKALGAPDGDRNMMAARIATYSNGAFDDKVFIKAA